MPEVQGVEPYQRFFVSQKVGAVIAKGKRGKSVVSGAYL